MHFVLRALRTARRAAASGLPVAEYVALRRERPSFDRRTFLQFTAGAAGAAVLGACGGAQQETVAGDLGLTMEEGPGPGVRILTRARAARVHGRWLDASRRSAGRRAG
jgi:hypothetical protein